VYTFMLRRRQPLAMRMADSLARRSDIPLLAALRSAA
jgi:hypothetical protein